MVKQLLLPLAGVAVFIILVGLFTQNPSKLGLGKYFPTAVIEQQKSMTVGSKTIQVEVVNTEQTREKGLGGRSSLGTDNGMLFVFDTKPVTPTFWMKDMLIPLDMIWISDSKIVKIDKHVPNQPANTPDEKLPIYTPGRAVDYVLEVNSGFSDSNNIKVGDSVILPTL
ncbi:MAG TPA: DUF192 domain-containing protein [Patescibacteria group bacterium]|nr:DUF192 domain-containing protein [Patescibacteria group bacterium]